MKILIVDDEPKIRKVLTAHFKILGHETVIAENGEMAIEAALTEDPDIVLLDYYMPLKNGLEVLQELKRRGFSAPIIMLTASDTAGVAVQTMKFGAADYMTKPFKLSELTETVQRIISEHRVKSRLDTEHRMDLDSAKEMQRSLLPRSYSGDHIRVEAYLQAARSVGGDFYNFYPVNNERFDFFIGDVVGKGVQASILMSHIMALFSEYKNCPTPAETLKAVNRKLMETIHEPVKSILATVFYAAYFPKSKTLKYASAGHPFPILCRRGEIMQEACSGEGMPFGLFSEIEITHNEMELTSADKLLLYTDGVSEARCANGDLYGQEYLFHALEQIKDLQPPEILEYIINDIHRLMDPDTGADDMALMCVTFV